MATPGKNMKLYYTVTIPIQSNTKYDIMHLTARSAKKIFTIHAGILIYIGIQFRSKLYSAKQWYRDI